MTPSAEPWLIAAISGRMLAASAARGGYESVVLDCFADRDTLASAPRSRSVSRAGAPRFDRRALLQAAAELAPAGTVAGLVCGSGFESRTGLLAALAKGRPLHGNTPGTITAVKDPSSFFPLLDRLGARHPAVRTAPPRDPAGWLVKRTGGAGGTHIRPASRRPPGRGSYFQRREPGRSLSALFLADGHDARLLGCNEQWTAEHPTLPFLYGGAVSHLALPAPVVAELETLVVGLSRATGLVGLNGLDFLLRGEELSVLELNPRPPATMELYDPDWAAGLFDAHLRACRGELPAVVPSAAAARAAALVLAPAAWSCREEFVFPPWCRDLPRPGTQVGQGQPLCTVHADGPTPELARDAVHQRRRVLQRILAGDPCVAEHR